MGLRGIVPRSPRCKRIYHKGYLLQRAICLHEHLAQLFNIGPRGVEPRNTRFLLLQPSKGVGCQGTWVPYIVNESVKPLAYEPLIISSFYLL